MTIEPDAANRPERLIRLSEILIKRRGLLGYSRTQVAQCVGISAVHLANIEMKKIVLSGS